ncbi:MAG TPA: class I SAM-dependent methyltransferase [Chloroflexia bacterium]|nr:class I SAM-dependent methyltransferase [Chloroflexia bacterium]
MTQLLDEPKTANIHFSDEVIRLTRAHWQAMGNHLLGPGTEKGMLEMLDEGRAEEEIATVANYVPFDLERRRLLEIGCGVGMSQLVARQKGILAYGIEPGPGVTVGKRLLQDHGFDPDTVVNGAGERLPFPDGSFDVVCSFQVLEHTRSPRRVLAETVRVLKPGGYFVHVFPNYGSFWEGHYGVPWIPHLPKSLGRIYIRLLGRDLSMINELQLLTHGQVERILRKHPDVRITDFGFDLWERRLRTLEFSEWAHLGKVKWAVRWLHRLRLVNLMVLLGRVFHFETPIVLVGTKVESK